MGGTAIGVVNRAFDPSLEVAGTASTTNSAWPDTAADTVIKRSGTLSRVTTRNATPASASMGGVYLVARTGSRIIPAVPGEAVSVSVWVRSSVASRGRISVFWRDASNATIGGSIPAPSYTNIPADTWTLLKFENVVAPALTAFIAAFHTVITVSGVTVGGEQVWTDNVMINDGPVSLDYFDGDSPGGTWTGTPNASPSAQQPLTTWTGTATGTAPARGTTTGSTVRNGSATGSRASKGAATGSTLRVGTATGSKTSRGAASGLRTYAGTAAGTAPARGTATGSTEHTGLATGNRATKGSADGTRLYVGAASGATGYAGAATGLRLHTGTASGTIAQTGATTGQTVYVGTTSGTTPLGSRDITVLSVSEVTRPFTVTDRSRVVTIRPVP